jgi:hypothetical protein
MNQTIEIIVSPTGQTRISTRGYSGPTCKEATRALEQALGLVEKDQPTPEMRLPASTPTTQPLRQR